MKKTIPQFTLKKIQTDFPRVKISSIKQSVDFIRQFYSDDIEVFESMFILLLDRDLKTIGFAKISQGGTTGTVVDVKIIAKYAIESLASAVVMAHNHPSGNTNPSDADIAITKKVQEVLGILEITLLDHIILTKDGYDSVGIYF